MPMAEIVSNNVPANQSNVDVLVGERVSQVDMLIRAARITIWAVASAVGLTYSMVVGGRTPMTTSVVPVSATPDQIIVNENMIISDIWAVRGEIIRLFLNEVAGVATNDFRMRINVQEV